MELVTLRRIAFRNGETDHSGMPSSTSISASGPALRSPPDRRVARDHRITWFIYGGLRQAFLRPVIFNLHSGEGLLHVSEQLARFRNPSGSPSRSSLAVSPLWRSIRRRWSKTCFFPTSRSSWLL
jgi:hypothetical protein